MNRDDIFPKLGLDGAQRDMAEATMRLFPESTWPVDAKERLAKAVDVTLGVYAAALSMLAEVACTVPDVIEGHHRAQLFVGMINGVSEANHLYAELIRRHLIKGSISVSGG